MIRESNEIENKKRTKIAKKRYWPITKFEEITNLEPRFGEKIWTKVNRLDPITNKRIGCAAELTVHFTT